MHWYDDQGNPKYTVKRADGKGERDTTLADAKKLGLFGSVTTILQQLAKSGGFFNWQQDQLLKAVINNPLHLYQHGIENWKKDIKKEAQKETLEAAKRGNQLHNKLEKYFTTGLIEEQDEDFVWPVIELLRKEFNGQQWVPEKSFAHPKGFGGKVDLHSKTLIIDFKTKGKDILDKKSLYNDYVIQLAAYRLGLSNLNLTSIKAKCYNLIISTTSPGVLMLHEWSEEDLQRGEEMFKALLQYWKILNKLQ